MNSEVEKAARELSMHYGWSNRLHTHEGCKRPEVSVIIPTYNCLAFLPKALRSIQLQQIDEIEILVLDDGSTDDTWRYLQLAAKCDKRIKPISLGGLGVAKARNYGLELATGRFIAFLDADDHWGPRKLHRQLSFHRQHPEVTLSFSNYLHFDPKERSLGDCFGYWSRFCRMMRKHSAHAQSGYVQLDRKGLGAIYAENVIGTSCVMIHPKAIGKPLFFDETLASAEDWDFWLQAAKAGPIACTSSIDMGYLMRPGSESAKTRLRLKFMARIQRRYLLTVALRRPSALLGCTSRLLTGYAELYRSGGGESGIQSATKSALCHLAAFVLSPSERLLRAAAADMLSFARHIGTYFQFANR